MQQEEIRDTYIHLHWLELVESQSIVKQSISKVRNKQAINLCSNYQTTEIWLELFLYMCQELLDKWDVQSIIIWLIFCGTEALESRNWLSREK